MEAFIAQHLSTALTNTHQGLPKVHIYFNPNPENPSLKAHCPNGPAINKPTTGLGRPMACNLVAHFSRHASPAVPGQAQTVLAICLMLRHRIQLNIERQG